MEQEEFNKIKQMMIDNQVFNLDTHKIASMEGIFTLKNNKIAKYTFLYVYRRKSDIQIPNCCAMDIFAYLN